MDWKAILHSGYLRGALCVLLIAAIVLGLWYPGSSLKAAEPENPLSEEGMREIAVLKMGESIQQLNTISVPGGVQARPNSEESREEPTEPQPSTGSDGSEGQAEGDQGADGGELSPENLSMMLTWQSEAAGAQRVVCGADKTQTVSVLSYELGEEELFRFSVRLTGNFAKDAKIINGVYTTDSDPRAKKLDVPSGTLKADSSTKKETYHLTFTVRIQGKDVLFRYDVAYRKVPDVKLSFTWYEKGRKPHELSCAPMGSVSDRVRNNQLSAGALRYKMEPTGDDAGSAQFLSARYSSDASGSDALEESGSFPMKLPVDASSDTYHITVNYLVSDQKLTYDIFLNYGNDVTLEMHYVTLSDDGRPTQQQVRCENDKSRTAQPVRDNQLENGLLEYEMTLVGEDAGSTEITSVECFRTGDGKTIKNLRDSDHVQLLLNGGKTGQNNFTVTARDRDNEEIEYTFKISIPYKHKGDNNIKITTNLGNETRIANETPVDLWVTAVSEDGSSISATGTDAFIRVVFDGAEISYESTSDNRWEYKLHPANPPTGDENTHHLYIYAEDAYGNYGEKTLEFTGYRVEPGHKIGEARIYVDMTTLGIGLLGPINYDVLADEPVSYVVAKAIMGKDTGEPFGQAKQTFGFSGSYAGTLDNGFYLQSLRTGYTADALEGNSWPGTTEEEVLDAIDARFGKRSGLATLWRCLYRNGLNKSTGSGGTFGEFDYTSGSGWMFSVGGDYYPGQSMSAIYLRDDDALILRYTLAYGWDIGGGSDGYGNTVGYCVKARDGNFDVNHRWETVENPDGTTYQMCHCCGLIEDCTHENAIYKDLEDGTHILFCQDCNTAIGDPEAHNWTHEGEGTEEKHICAECGAAETHFWEEVEGSNTATCTEPGVRTVRCSVCEMTREEEVPPKGHTLDNRWNYTAAEHYQKCSTCGEEANRGSHQYVYDAGWDDYVCTVCNALHDFDVGCSGPLTIREATCQRILYHCDGCGHDLVRDGTFEDYHAYENGFCRYCGAEDPDYMPEHEHDYHETERKEPTCTESGYILYVCECGDSYSQTLSAAGHAWSEWTVVREPTTEEAGERTRYCENCGETESEQIDPIWEEPQMYFLARLFRSFL